MITMAPELEQLIRSFVENNDWSERAIHEACKRMRKMLPFDIIAERHFLFLAYGFKRRMENDVN